MSLKKTAKLESPHATFVNDDGWEWRILKVYRAAKSDRGDQYARWFLAAKSPFTFGEFEMGDTYINDVVRHARLVSSSPEFGEYYRELTA